MKRNIFEPEHDLFRGRFRLFLEREVVPEYPRWERDGIVSREAWQKAGQNGFVCHWLPEEYGGLGTDFRYSVVEIEELSRLWVTGFGLFIHSDIITPYIWNFGDDEQKKRWLPKCASAEIITAIAMTEPDTGSDLQAIKTTAVRDGDHYLVNGQKTFISNGIMNDLVIAAVKTDPRATPAYKGMTLIAIEAGTPGYEKGRNLEKIGWHAQDTAELAFTDCRVPVKNRIGGEGEGFMILMRELQQERLVLAISGVAAMWSVLEMTRQYISERKAFGRALAAFQNTRFKMAEMYTVAELSQAFIDRLVTAHMAGEDVNTETAMAKYWASENLKIITDQCLQFFGGFGCMEEYPMARAYRDSRLQTIFAGSSEIMKQIIAKARLD